MANTFKSYQLKAVGITATNVYTANAGTQTTVIGMTVSNLISTPIDCNVMMCRPSGTYAGHTGNVYIIKGATVAPGGSLVPIGGDQKLVLQVGDYLQVNTSIASSADVILSVLEIT